MKRVTLYKDNDTIICWADTAKKLLANGWSADEPKKGKSQKPKKSDTVATEINEV